MPNTYTSQQLIESRINEIRNDLPTNTRLTIERMSPSITSSDGLYAASKNKNLIELKQIAKYTVRPFLSQLQGISQIQVQGSKEKEYWAMLHPDAMGQLGITPSLVQSAISNSGFLEFNGFATDYGRLYLTLIDASVFTLQYMKELVISNDGNRVVRAIC